MPSPMLDASCGLVCRCSVAVAGATAPWLTTAASPPVPHTRPRPQIFTHYADHHSRKTRILRDQMFKFAKDFHLTPRLCTRKEMHDIVSTAVSQDGAFVTFPHFLECIGMIAIIGFSKVRASASTCRWPATLTALPPPRFDCDRAAGL